MNETQKAECPYKPGDVVMLKSGGPAMTVTGGYATAVGCMWFLLDGTERTATFNPEAVTKGLLNWPPLRMS